RLIYANLHKRLELIASSNVRPDEKLKGVISEIEDFYDHNHAYLSIMLREATEGGENLDDETLRLLVPVRSAIFDIVHEGIKEGSFRNIPPLVAYYVILSPIMLFLVAAPLRSALSHLRVPTSSDLTPEVFVKHLEETIHAAIRRPSEVVVRPAERLALR
ncbi:MAG TPA: hypothetical protein VGX46_16675, partial [Vicinamibacterales bacterium]|nr:hypothetical protein [Vicinamibacterales bacterium]